MASAEDRLTKFLNKTALIVVAIFLFFSFFIACYLVHSIGLTREPYINFFLSLYSDKNYTTSLKFYKHSSVQPFCDIVNDEKFDCHPDVPISEENCLKRGCCWNPLSFTKGSFPPLGVPYCYYPKGYNGYEVVSFLNNKFEKTIRLRRVRASTFPSDSINIKVLINLIDNDRIRIKIYNPDVKRFEVPFPILNATSTNINNPQYDCNFSSGILSISRLSTRKVLFKTDLQRLVFSDRFIQFSSILPSELLYGLGEHKTTHRKHVNWQRLSFFNRDYSPMPNMSLYGSYPFYLSIEDESHAHGVLLFNSNAMDAILQPTPAITWNVVGGILDFYILFGPTVSDVIRQNMELIGKPPMPPYWSLGFHLCKYNYGSANKTKEVMMRNINAGIPFDVQWNDIDYMDRKNDFTYDNHKFAELPDLVNEIHQRGMHYVPIFDSGVSGSEPKGKYSPLDDGLKEDIFIKDYEGKLFYGKVWNEVNTLWPDFTNIKTIAYWTRQFMKFYRQIQFDGAWIDMNEPSNLIDPRSQRCPADHYLENIPYTPNNIPLSSKTICMSARHAIGSHYDIHNLYSLYQTYVTNIALKIVLKKRPFIISRSSFIGQGHYGGHWSGDVFSKWDDLQYSISNMFDFNLFGNPMIGTDICGFVGNTTEELCARWSSLGAFYPFSRNHNENESIEQDPVILGEKVVAAAKNALYVKYKFLPYLYTLFYFAHTRGSTVIRPLFIDYPDQNTYYIESQFLWGSGMMILPIITQYTNELQAYFPAGVWYTYFGKEIINGPKFKKLILNIEQIEIAFSGGHIFPCHHSTKFTTTTESRKAPFSLLVVLNEKGFALGDLFWDDGESINNIILGEYNFIAFEFKNNILTSKPVLYGYNDSMTIDEVKILGLPSGEWEVSDGNKKVKCLSDSSLELACSNLNLKMASPFELKFSIINAFGKNANFTINARELIKIYD